MLRQLALALSIVLVGSAALASSIGVYSVTQGAATPAELSGKSMGELIHMGMTDPRFEARVQHYLADHGLDHPKAIDLGSLSPLEAAQFQLNHNIRNGRSVLDWVELAKAENLLSLRQTEARVDVEDLATEIARLDETVAGVPLTSEQMAALRADVARVPAELQAPLARLVAATADAYAAQAPIAASVLARLPGMDEATDFALTAQEGEATLQNALALVAAQNAFRAEVVDLKVATPFVSDPLGLFILGSSGDDTIGADGQFGDAVLIVEPSGNDVYDNSAAGACPDLTQVVHACNGLVASMVVDLLGDDSYTYEGRPAAVQGSGSMGGVGVLVDIAGNDLYKSYFIQPNQVADLQGGILGYIDAGSQGFGMAGAGFLVDAVGDDVYEADITSGRVSAWVFSQGFGNAGGFGISADGRGNDQWLSYGFESQGLSGFQGLYPGGTGFFGGLGIMSDTGLGSDAYHAWDNASSTDFYAYGFGAFGGTGIFFEDGGDDHYEAVESSTSATPLIVPLLNCAFGTASFAGLGVFLEMGGNDFYFGDSITAPNPTRNLPVATMNEGFGGPAEGEGVFVDVSGDDGHFMEAHPEGVLNYEQTYGRGALLGGGEGLFGNTVGVYLDMGGNDAYTGASPSGNNRVWPAGLDFEAGSVPTLRTV